ncbi:MAG: hypothetical protein QM784_15690 [Polyangiaceae bacterium]
MAFGELFFQEAQADPSKWDLAAAAYKEVIKFPPPKNKAYGYARYKLGYVHWNKGEYAEALNEFKAVIEFGDKFVDLPNAKQLAKSARRDTHSGLRRQRRAYEAGMGSSNLSSIREVRMPRPSTCSTSWGSHVSRHQSLSRSHRPLQYTGLDESGQGRSLLSLPDPDHGLPFPR